MLEVGVWRGASSGIIGKSAQLNGIQDTLYLCDTFEGVVKAGPKDSTYVGNEHSNTTIDKVNEVIKKLELKNVKVLKGIFPDETSNQVTDKSFKFCHIDVDVYKSAEDIFNWIWPKMEIGGIVVFDDYGFSMCDGITKFVNENRSRDDLCYVHNLNGHAIFIKSRESNRKQ
jgi:O-methyltransferase